MPKFAAMADEPIAAQVLFEDSITVWDRDRVWTHTPDGLRMAVGPPSVAPPTVRSRQRSGRF